MVTKTIGPFHFEDLEPHRFEDLVRNLLYDFRNWSSLEPTGRGGTDDGYDARGWERISTPRSSIIESDEDDSPEVESSRVWMIQCKREKKLGPSDVQRIIKETIDPKSPPYGFLLAAPVSFTKRTYDAFRSELTLRGVQEFYLWGKGEIEDQLLQPKNDRILFAFMGVSLSTRRRSRTTDVRAISNIKNKLAKVIGDGGFPNEIHEMVLFRDIDDDCYPYKADSPTFSTHPAWQEYRAISLQPTFLVVLIEEHYAWIDSANKQYDVADQSSLIFSDRDRENRNWQLEVQIRDFHEHLGMASRATYKRFGIIPYKNILFVDEKGDGLFKMPHIFANFSAGTEKFPFFGPFSKISEVLEDEQGGRYFLSREPFQKIDFFPEKFPELEDPRVLAGREIDLPSYVRARLRKENFILIDPDMRYGELKPKDVVKLTPGESRRDEGPKAIEVVHISIGTLENLKNSVPLDPYTIPQEWRENGTQEMRAIEIKSSYRIGD